MPWPRAPAPRRSSFPAQSPNSSRCSLPADGPAFLVTRPEPGAEKLADALAAAIPAARLFVAPLTNIEPLGAALPRRAAADAVLLTSPRAAPHAKPLSSLPAWVVGTATADAARRAGFEVTFVGDDALDEALLGSVPPGTRLLHIAGRHVSTDPAAAFAARGVSYSRIAVYDAVAATRPPPGLAEFLQADGPRYATFLSARAVEIYAQLVGRQAPPLPTALCASPRIEDAARRSGQFGGTICAPSPVLGGFVDFARARCT